jgi:hypothetical protein
MRPDTPVYNEFSDHKRQDLDVKADNHQELMAKQAEKD